MEGRGVEREDNTRAGTVGNDVGGAVVVLVVEEWVAGDCGGGGGDRSTCQVVVAS